MNKVFFNLFCFFICACIFIGCNGKEHLTYYDNSKTKLFSKGEMKDGRMVGKWEFYYPTGEIKSIEHFSNNILTGECKEYYKNGKIMAEGCYSGDTLCASRDTSDSVAGIITISGCMACKTGVWKYYDSSGRVIIIQYKSCKEKD